MTEHDTQLRAAELIEQAISNLSDGIGCDTTNALKLLLVQSALRLPAEDVRKSLQFILN